MVTRVGLSLVVAAIVAAVASVSPVRRIAPGNRKTVDPLATAAFLARRC
jgi:hypothetical protein